MRNPPSAASIFDYWRATEMFAPQATPKIAPLDSETPVFPARPGSPLPWELGHPIKHRGLPAGKSRKYFVYCGVFGLELMRSLMEAKVGKDPESFDSSDKATCLCGFAVSDTGRPLFESFVLSSCAWAMGRTVAPGPASTEWLVGFEDECKRVAEDFEIQFALEADDDQGQRLRADGIPVGRAIALPEMLAYTKRLAQQLHLAEVLPALEIRVKCQVVETARKNDSPDQDMINSFYLRDLAVVADHARGHKIGAALAEFVKEKPRFKERVDVRKSMPLLARQLAPSLFPRGRWPGKGHHPLVFSQQFAVNAIFQTLGDGSGLFAVNGPPGTGKTTLLRDLVAGIVVDRAQRLAALDHPRDAFSGEGRWRSGEYTRVIALWKDDLKGSEIVVASNNNGAVENISFEIPGLDAVDPLWLEAAADDYFRDFGTRLLEAPAWAMVAARLGNKANRNDFINRFWSEDRKATKAPAAESAAGGFLNWLKAQESKPRGDWHAARRRFLLAVRQENTLRQEREAVYAACTRQAQLNLEVIQRVQAAEAAEQALDGAWNQQREAKAEAERGEARVEQTEARRLSHRRFKPGLIEIVFTLGKAFRQWLATDQPLLAACEDARATLAEALRNQALARLAHEKAASAAKEAKGALARVKADLDAANALIAEGKQGLGSAFPDVGSWDSDERARESSSPWADAKWNSARAAVFLAALDLHKDFICAIPDTFRKNMHGAMDLLRGTVPADTRLEAIQAAWTTLFFAVPVVSTTFASFDRLFAHLGCESLGWVLIDEAGQAPPAAAAGAIWRARRVVVVGDPLQLEPVVALPFTAQQGLRRHYDVSETWLPGRTSVQQLADRTAKYGTLVQSQDEPLWVGAPLRVHRRCDRVMFDISNTTAYNGMMVFGTESRPEIVLPASQWIHVSSKATLGHWSPEEGQAAMKIIALALESGVKPQQIFLISPFRIVVEKLRQLASEFPGIQAGTIHTVQGKEADVVVLVLGGDPSRPGAKAWASSKPNLVNVAASRARRRLYVVGNQDEWRRYPYFGTVSSLLTRSEREPVLLWTPLGT